MSFHKIGAGWVRTTKKGKDYITMSLDQDALSAMGTQAYRRIFVFENQKQDNIAAPQYVVMVPVDDEEEHSQSDADKPYVNSSGEPTPF